MLNTLTSNSLKVTGGSDGFWFFFGASSSSSPDPEGTLAGGAGSAISDGVSTLVDRDSEEFGDGVSDDLFTEDKSSVR